MRLGALPALVVLGTTLVSASPVRLIAEVNASGAVRYGHAAAHLMPFPEAIPPPKIESGTVIFTDSTVFATGRTGRTRHLCQSMRDKAIEASNFLRQFLGLDPITTSPSSPGGPIIVSHIPHSPAVAHNKDDLVRILPIIGTPNLPEVALNPESRRPLDHHHHHGHGAQGDAQMMRAHRYNHRLHGSFLRRVHHALMALGPWEGRAVAFVLGCGIGVLLRMFWVMVLVTARAVRGAPREEEYTVVFDEAEMLVPPPQYTTIDDVEAVPVTIDEKPEKEALA